jgi:mercuric ion binding protein
LSQPTACQIGAPAKAVVSYADKTAVVTFDDAKTVPALITATTNAGYPSSLKG